MVHEGCPVLQLNTACVSSVTWVMLPVTEWEQSEHILSSSPAGLWHEEWSFGCQEGYLLGGSLPCECLTGPQELP